MQFPSLDGQIFSLTVVRRTRAERLKIAAELKATKWQLIPTLSNESLVDLSLSTISSEQRESEKDISNLLVDDRIEIGCGMLHTELVYQED